MFNEEADRKSWHRMVKYFKINSKGKSITNEYSYIYYFIGDDKCFYSSVDSNSCKQKE